MGVWGDAEAVVGAFADEPEYALLGIGVKTYYFRMFLCYLIVTNQYIHLLFPDLFFPENYSFTDNL